MTDRQERVESLRDEHGNLFDVIAEILFKNDPIGINFASNADEYEPEAETILPRLETCYSVEDVLSVVHQEFCHWFTPEIAGPEERYQEVAEDIWRVWRLRARTLG